MKGILLLAIIAVSLRLYAQSKAPEFSRLIPSSNSMPAVKSPLADERLKRSGEPFRIKSGSLLVDMDTVIPTPDFLYDSIHTWNWDTEMIEWHLNSRVKFVDIKYDENHHLLSYTEQYNFDSTFHNLVKREFTYDENNNEASYTVLGWDGFNWNLNEQFVYTHDLHHHLTSATHIFWNGSLVHDYKNLYTYDGNNRVKQAFIQSWDGTAWKDYDKITLNYDTSNNLISEILEHRNTVDWENFIRIIYTFDANNNQTSFTWQPWNGTFFTDAIRAVYTYDSHNNLTSDLYQISDGDMLVNESLLLYGYDGHNNLTSQLSQIWDNNSWINNWIYTYAYDSLNNNLSALYQTWEESKWRNNYLITYTYDANNNIKTSILQEWYGAWANQFKNTYTYDAHNNLLSNLSQIWSEDWESMYIYINSYDEYNFLTGNSYTTFDYYEGNGTIITGGDSTHYFINSITAVKELIPQVDDLILYPNPTSGSFTISSQSNFSSIEIYTLAGERIYSLTSAQGQHDYEIHLTGHPKGTYVLNINNGAKKYNRMIVVQ